MLYSAHFVKNIPELLKMFPPKHVQVFAHHSTIEFQPANLDGLEIGKESKMKILGRAFDEMGDALLVENPKSKNKYPHITISCAEGTEPVYSNELLKKADASNSIEYFSTPYEIDVVEGYSDGKTDFVEVKM